MAAHPSYLGGSTTSRWLMPAAEMAGLASSGWRPSPDRAVKRWAFRPRIATLTLGPDTGSVRVARDFSIATLHRWGTVERSHDIAIVVSELLTNALRHGLPGSAAIRRRRPIRLGLVQPGPCVLCAVADPSRAAPVLQAPGSLAETGRGLHLICALSDQWGYTALGDTGKVVWATFYLGLAVALDVDPSNAANTALLQYLRPGRNLIVLPGQLSCRPSRLREGRRLPLAKGEAAVGTGPEPSGAI